MWSWDLIKCHDQPFPIQWLHMTLLDFQLHYVTSGNVLCICLVWLKLPVGVVSNPTAGGKWRVIHLRALEAENDLWKCCGWERVNKCPYFRGVVPLYLGNEAWSYCSHDFFLSAGSLQLWLCGDKTLCALVRELDVTVKALLVYVCRCFCFCEVNTGRQVQYLLLCYIQIW